MTSDSKFTMPRSYVKKVGGRLYQNYNPGAIKNAVDAVRYKKMSLRRASEAFGVPKSTISDHLNSKEPIKKCGGQTVLNTNEENLLVEGLLKCSEWGFPMKCRDIQLVVQSYLDRLGKSINKNNRFKNNLPGKDWVELFLKRNNTLSLRFGENIKRVRAAVSTSVLNEYFDNLYAVLKDIPPENIFNYDETNFVDDPGKKLVVVKRGTKHPEVIKDTSKTSISVMFCVSADGKMLPPYTVYKAKHMYPTWVEGGVEGACYNRNDSGWFDMPIFEDWFFKCFLPTCRYLKGPKVMIGDNLSSHISLEVIQLCEKNNIRFILLPPNATHLCQPLDVAVFRPIKRSWRMLLDDWKDKNSGPIPKSEFPKLLRNTLEKLHESMQNNIKSGFNATGIYPFNKQKVLNKIPNRSEDGDNDLSNSWTEAFVDILSDVRNRKELVKKSRGKKINISAGKSVRIEDLKKKDEPLGSEHLEVFNEIQEENSTDIYAPSTSGTQKNKILEIINEEDCIDPNIVLKRDDFIIVKYETNKRNVMYIGQVEKVKTPLICVNFLRKKTSSQEGPYFVFPQVKDKSNITKLQVVRKLVPTKIMKRGRFIFDDIDISNFN